MTELEKFIEKETSKDLINIHNFLVSVFICPKDEDEKELSVFALMLKLQFELHSRKDAKIKDYLDKVQTLLS